MYGKNNLQIKSEICSLNIIFFEQLLVSCEKMATSIGYILKQYIKSNILEQFELILFIISTVLFYLQLNLISSLISLILLVPCIIIKYHNIVKSKQVKYMIKSITSYSSGYILTATQIVFYYQAVNSSQNPNLPQLYIKIPYYAIRNFLLSILLQNNTASMMELLVFSACEVAILIVNMVYSLQFISYYDEQTTGYDFTKDCYLLAITTAICISAQFLDLFFRVYEEKIQQIRQEKMKMLESTIRIHNQIQVKLVQKQKNNHQNKHKQQHKQKFSLLNCIKSNIVQLTQIIFMILSLIFDFLQGNILRQAASNNLTNEILACAFITASFLIKITRIIYQKKLISSFKAILSFYYGYILTILQIIFYYQGFLNAYENGLPINMTAIYLSCYFTIAINFSFSLILSTSTGSYYQLLVYTLGQIALLVLNIINSLKIFQLFDQILDDPIFNFVQDTELISIAISIAISCLFVDLFYRVFEKKNQLKEKGQTQEQSHVKIKQKIKQFIGHIPKQIKQKYIQLIQVVFLLTAIILFYSNNNYICQLIAVIFTFGLLITKLAQTIRKKLYKQTLQAIFSFYYGFILTGLQMFFYYHALTSININGEFIQILEALNLDTSFFTSQNIKLILTLLFFCIRNINFSLILHHKTGSYLQLFIYSICEIVIMICLNFQIISLLKIFDNPDLDQLDQFFDLSVDYIKDLLILALMTGVAISALFLDLFFRIYEEKRQIKRKNNKNNKKKDTHK